MTQAQLERSVAAATGESRRTIRDFGFSLANPRDVTFDPEPSADAPYLDWDDVAGRRHTQLAIH